MQCMILVVRKQHFYGHQGHFALAWCIWWLLRVPDNTQGVVAMDVGFVFGATCWDDIPFPVRSWDLSFCIQHHSTALLWHNLLFFAWQVCFFSCIAGTIKTKTSQCKNGRISFSMAWSWNTKQVVCFSDIWVQLPEAFWQTLLFSDKARWNQKNKRSASFASFTHKETRN